MATERQRLLELALESLEGRRNRIDEEITALRRELRGGRGRTAVGAAVSRMPAASARVSKKRSRFSQDERKRRSQRMKAYWENWRKQKGRPK